MFKIVGKGNQDCIWSMDNLILIALKLKNCLDNTFFLVELWHILVKGSSFYFIL